MQITDYELIDDSYGRNGLVQEIQMMLLNGWQPFGSPFSNRNKRTQAMVKYESAESENVSLNKNTVVYGKDKNNESSLEGMIHDKLLNRIKILEETIIALIEKYAKYSHGEGYWIETDYDEYYSESDNHKNYATEILESIIKHRTRLEEKCK